MHVTESGVSDLAKKSVEYSLLKIGRAIRVCTSDNTARAKSIKGEYQKNTERTP